MTTDPLKRLTIELKKAKFTNLSASTENCDHWFIEMCGDDVNL